MESVKNNSIEDLGFAYESNQKDKDYEIKKL